jgi:hypothetical protein
MLVKVRFDQYSNEQKNFKINQKNEKPVHIVFLCHILTTEAIKHDLHRFKQKNHVCSVISRTLLYEVNGEERWFRFWNMKSVKTNTKLPFGVTKKDADLVFHFYVSKKFKC